MPSQVFYEKPRESKTPTKTRHTTIEEVEDEEVMITTLWNAEPIGPQETEGTRKENPAQENHKLAMEQQKRTAKSEITDDGLLVA